MIDDVIVLTFLNHYQRFTFLETVIISVIFQVGKVENGSDFCKIVPFAKTNPKNARQKLFDLSRRGVLKKCKISDDDCFKMLNRQFENGCLFCGFDKTQLDNHHFPIRKKNGGKKTINLCPNCHRLFHKYTDYGHFELSDDMKIFITEYMNG